MSSTYIKIQPEKNGNFIDQEKTERKKIWNCHNAFRLSLMRDAHRWRTIDYIVRLLERKRQQR